VLIVAIRMSRGRQAKVLVMEALMIAVKWDRDSRIRQGASMTLTKLMADDVLEPTSRHHAKKLSQKARIDR
jgi:hypothetical protein